MDTLGTSAHLIREPESRLSGLSIIGDDCGDTYEITMWHNYERNDVHIVHDRAETPEMRRSPIELWRTKQQSSLDLVATSSIAVLVSRRRT